MNDLLAGKLVLVTGAANGIGLACARRACEWGARVIAADLNGAAAREVASALGIHAACFDVSDELGVENAIEEAELEFGAIDALVNAAGVLQRVLPPDQLSMREWDIVHRVDLRGSYVTAAALGRRMAVRRHGAIVLIASVAGMRSAPLHGYGPAKAGVIATAQCLAAEWGPANVRVNSVSPGFTDTPALQRGIEQKMMDPARMIASTALGRLLAPREIADAALFLLSDLATGITGINLPVDAGYLVSTPWQAYGDASE